mmetsp:Transcript_60177/g.127468  ORF Transcript_60177/g.127468 Transcript_60177/m.127468 type:complete len:150 (+) Transcript_60177:140-589(+)
MARGERTTKERTKEIGDGQFQEGARFVCATPGRAATLEVLVCTHNPTWCKKERNEHQTGACCEGGERVGEHELPQKEHEGVKTHQATTLILNTFHDQESNGNEEVSQVATDGNSIPTRVQCISRRIHSSACAAFEVSSLCFVEEANPSV